MLCWINRCVRPVWLLMMTQLLIIQNYSWEISRTRRSRIHHIRHVKNVLFLLLLLLLACFLNKLLLLFLILLCLTVWIIWNVIPLLVNEVLHWVIADRGNWILILFDEYPASSFNGTVLNRVILMLRNNQRFIAYRFFITCITRSNLMIIIQIGCLDTMSFTCCG